MSQTVALVRMHWLTDVKSKVNFHFTVSLIQPSS